MLCRTQVLCCIEAVRIIKHETTGRTVRIGGEWKTCCPLRPSVSPVCLPVSSDALLRVHVFLLTPSDRQGSHRPDCAQSGFETKTWLIPVLNLLPLLVFAASPEAGRSSSQGLAHCTRTSLVAPESRYRITWILCRKRAVAA